MQKVLDVHIGEIKIARKGEILRAILGSCVGVGFIWREKNICGLAHCLLAESPVPTFEIGARFVDQAVRSLLALMKIRAEDAAQIEVVIVGGGNMTSPGAPETKRLVGTHNFSIALREVQKNNLRVVHSDGGGEEGRKIFIDAKDFSYRIEKIPRIIEAS